MLSCRVGEREAVQIERKILLCADRDALCHIAKEHDRVAVLCGRDRICKRCKGIDGIAALDLRLRFLGSNDRIRAVLRVVAECGRIRKIALADGVVEHTFFYKNFPALIDGLRTGSRQIVRLDFSAHDNIAAGNRQVSAHHIAAVVFVCPRIDIAVECAAGNGADRPVLHRLICQVTVNVVKRTAVDDKFVDLIVLHGNAVGCKRTAVNGKIRSLRLLAGRVPPACNSARTLARLQHRDAIVDLHRAMVLNDVVVVRRCSCERTARERCCGIFPVIESCLTTCDIRHSACLFGTAVNDRERAVVDDRVLSCRVGECEAVQIERERSALRNLNALRQGLAETDDIVIVVCKFAVAGHCRHKRFFRIDGRNRLTFRIRRVHSACARRLRLFDRGISRERAVRRKRDDRIFRKVAARDLPVRVAEKRIAPDKRAAADDHALRAVFIRRVIVDVHGKRGTRLIPVERLCAFIDERSAIDIDHAAESGKQAGFGIGIDNYLARPDDHGRALGHGRQGNSALVRSGIGAGRIDHTRAVLTGIDERECARAHIERGTVSDPRGDGDRLPVQIERNALFDLNALRDRGSRNDNDRVAVLRSRKGIRKLLICNGTCLICHHCRTGRLNFLTVQNAVRSVAVIREHTPGCHIFGIGRKIERASGDFNIPVCRREIGQSTGSDKRRTRQSDIGICNIYIDRGRVRTGIVSAVINHGLRRCARRLRNNVRIHNAKRDIPVLKHDRAELIIVAVMYRLRRDR